MRIILVHNFYGSSAPSGENLVFQAEMKLLQSHGHEVAEFVRHSDEIRSKGWVGAAIGALATPWNPWMVQALRREVEHFHPDVVHVHNTFPLISPAIFHAIGYRSAKVLTLHNYRLFCPAAIPMRNGITCTDCLDGHTSIPAMIHGCYRGSRLATVPLAASVELHRAIGTWTREVDAFIALTSFQRDLMIAAGLPEKLVQVKPNFYPGNPTPIPWSERGDYVVFAGRMTQEKGIDALLRAWALLGEHAPELRIVGDGPLRSSLENASHGLKIRFLGQLPTDEAQAQIARAKLLILPSECFEGFPMVIVEAFAFGTPAAVSDIGPLPSIIKHGNNGVLFAPGDPESIMHAVRNLWLSPLELERMAIEARRTYEALYTDDVNYKRLMDIYELAASSKFRKMKT